MGFGHCSFYLLTLEQNTPFFKSYKYDMNPLPTNDVVCDMFEFTNEFLEKKGFCHYEVSNFARVKESESKHNLMYWEGD